MSASREQEASAIADAPRPTTLIGQLLLPGEGGQADVELRVSLTVWVAAPDGETRQLWIFPDADGRFTSEIPGVLNRVSVFAGSEVYRVELADLPRADASGQVDLGSIDLRASLVVWRVRVRAAEGAPGGVVRIGRWVGSPHRGPLGELPALGSKQFPTLELGREIEWLLPPDASAVHFLVERPDGPGRGRHWRGGPQQVFGPYDASEPPLELVLN